MTLMRQKIYWLVPIFGLLLAGCGPTRPPNTGIEDASRSVDTARNAGAGTYAPLEVRAAEERLSAARAAADKHDYDDATQFAEESRANSDLATAKSRLGKAREKAEARTRENSQLQHDLSANPADSANPGAQP